MSLKKIKKKYSEKQRIYQAASQKSLTQEQLLQEMTDDIERLGYAITDCVDRIAQYNNRLKEIALRPDPLSTLQYLNMMIEGEKREKKKDFESRIKALEQCKQRTQYGESVQVFNDRLRKTKEIFNATVDDKESSSGLVQSAKKYGKKFIHAINM